MVVEVLDVPQVRHRRTEVGVEVGRAVSRHVQAGTGREGRRGEEAGDPPAPGYVELQAVDGPGADEARRIRQRLAVLARGHVRLDPGADRGQPGQVLR